MSEHNRSAGDGDTPARRRESLIRAMTFIVRTSWTETGRVIGVVEHVRTGRKERFDGVDGISSVIAALIRAVDGRG